MPESEPKAAAPASEGGSPLKPPSGNKDSAAAAAPAAEPAPPPADAGVGGGGGDDEDMLLVTEFPPPPYYYTLAARGTPSHLRLTPPDIPRRAFRVAAKRVMNERRKAREESERIRLEAEGEPSHAAVASSGVGENADGDVSMKASLEKSADQRAEPSSATAKSSSAAGTEEDDDSIDPDDPNEPVVAVFGEIVEDPTLVVEEECHDPVEIRENVKRLNRTVLQGFLRLVQKLVHDPNDNKKLRDELSHNLFLMLQECNKFREHQAREILIATLEQQLDRRRKGLELLKRQIREADEALASLEKFKKN